MSDPTNSVEIELREVWPGGSFGSPPLGLPFDSILASGVVEWDDTALAEEPYGYVRAVTVEAWDDAGKAVPVRDHLSAAQYQRLADEGEVRLVQGAWEAGERARREEAVEP